MSECIRTRDARFGRYRLRLSDLKDNADLLRDLMRLAYERRTA